MALTGTAERLMIYLEQTDHRGSTPAYVEIVERARKADLAGATVLQGIEGFGVTSRVHRHHTLSVVEDVPVVVVVIDTPTRIESFVASLDDMHLEGLVVRQPVEVVAHRPRSTRRR